MPCTAGTANFQLGTECLKEGKFGMDYRGTVATGKSGAKCKIWTAKPYYMVEERGSGNPHSFCRQPSKQPKPWCYIFPSGWEHCSIPSCTHLEDGTGGYGNFRRWMNLFQHLRTEKKMSASAITTAVTKAKASTTFKFTNKGNEFGFYCIIENLCLSDCIMKGVFNGKEYRGTLNVTVDEKACIRWDTPMDNPTNDNWWSPLNIDLFGLEENYCRDPDWQAGPWCYTGKDGSWGLCSIPYCDEQLGKVIEEDIPRSLSMTDDEIHVVENTNLETSSELQWVEGYEAFLFLLSTKASKVHQAFQALVENGKAEELLLTLVQFLQSVEKMNLISLNEADQEELKTISTMIFSHLEKGKDLKARELYKALSMEHSKLLADYQNIFPETDDDFESCINDGWIDAENCKALTNSFDALNIPDIGRLSNHPVHIKDDIGNMYPSSFIPFCRVGGIMVSVFLRNC